MPEWRHKAAYRKVRLATIRLKSLMQPRYLRGVE